MHKIGTRNSIAATPSKHRQRQRAARNVTSSSPHTLEPLEYRHYLTTYYVSPTGNDNNAGTSINAPLQRFQLAASLLKKGDTLNLEPGRYDEGLILAWDTDGVYGPLIGTAAAPITIQADPAAAPGSVIIDGQNAKTLDAIDLEPGNSWVVFKGLTLSNDRGLITQDGIRVTTSDNISVLNCTVSGMLRFGIFCSFTHNFLVQNNTVINNPGTGDGETGHGIYISNSSVNPIIRGNYVAGNGSEGIHLNGDLSDGGNGLISGALIEDNTIVNNINNGINADGLVNSRIQNNLIYGSTKHGIALYHIDAATGSDNNIVVNNTIVEPASSGAAIEIVQNSTGNVIFNNVLIGGAQGTLNVSDDSMAGLVSDYNAVVNHFENDDSGAVSSLAQWRQASGHDLHSFTLNLPLAFNNLVANDYFPRTGSPLIHAGIASLAAATAPLIDLNGAARAGAPPDVGAIEYLAAGRPNNNPMGFIDIANARFISGWTADMDAPGTALTVRLDVDGATLLSTTAATTRNDLLPIIGFANHGFSFSLSSLTPGIHRIDVYATDVNTSQAVLIGSRLVSTNIPPTGWVDVLTSGRVAGWAADPDAGAAPIQVRIAVDNNAPIILTANTNRTDLMSLLGSTNHGFAAALPALTAGNHTVSIYAIDSTSFAALLLATRTLTIASPAGNALPVGSVDIATPTAISGWAMDLTSRGSSIQVRVDVDGAAGTPFTANIVRADVAKAMKINGNFGFRLALSLSPGEHRVDVFALDGTSGTPVLLGSRIVGATGLLGSIDMLTATHIAGWAYSPALGGASATIRIDIDSLAGTPVAANLSRPDLVPFLPATHFAFNTSLPTLTPGKHTVTLLVLDPLTMIFTPLLTKSITV